MNLKDIYHMYNAGFKVSLAQDGFLVDTGMTVSSTVSQ